jgi:GTPase
LHVVDVSSPDAMKQIESVNTVLSEIECSEKQIQLVLNKVDVVSGLNTLEMLQTLYPEAICVSAKTGFGLDKLHQAVMERYKGSELHIKVIAKLSDGRIQSFLRAYSRIIDEKYSDSKVVIEARLGKNQLTDLKRLKPEKLEIIEE